jgi:hypothetical protein
MKGVKGSRKNGPAFAQKLRRGKQRTGQKEQRTEDSPETVTLRLNNQRLILTNLRIHGFIQHVL